MRLIHKSFLFQSDQRVSPNAIETNGLKLVVNGVITDLSIKELVTEYSLSAGYVKGWSLLMFLEDPTKKEVFDSLVIEDHQFQISFVGPTGTLYTVYKIKDPTFQFSDKVITQAEVDRMMALLASTQPTAEEPATAEEVSKEVAEAYKKKAAEVEAEAIKGESEAAATDSGPAETPAAPAKEEAPATEEAPAEEILGIREELVGTGYIEHTFEDYSLFVKPGEDPKIYASENGELEELGIEEFEKNEDDLDYFTTHAGEEIVFTFNVETETLKVEQTETEA